MNSHIDQDNRKSSKNLMMSVWHFPAGNRKSTLHFHFPDNLFEDKDVQDHTVDILEKIVELINESNVDEVQNFEVTEEFPIFLQWDHGDSEELEINFDVWTKSLKAYIKLAFTTWSKQIKEGKFPEVINGKKETKL